MPRREPARGEAHKGDAVAVLRVDIGLHLEHKPGDIRLVGQDRMRPIGAQGRLRAWRRRHFGDAVQ